MLLVLLSNIVEYLIISPKIYDKKLLEFVRVQQLHYRFYSISNPMS